MEKHGSAMACEKAVFIIVLEKENKGEMKGSEEGTPALTRTLFKSLGYIKHI